MTLASTTKSGCTVITYIAVLDIHTDEARAVSIMSSPFVIRRVHGLTHHVDEALQHSCHLESDLSVSR